jgi:hypothetical protein
VIVYHRTLHAEAIERDGFRDAEGRIGDRLWRGVWVFDWVHALFGGHEGALADGVVLALEIPDELFPQYEWVEEYGAYTTAVIPAAILNEHLATLRRVEAPDLEGPSEGETS